MEDIVELITPELSSDNIEIDARDEEVSGIVRVEHIGCNTDED